MTLELNMCWYRLLMAVAPGLMERRELERRFNEIVKLHDNLIMRLCFGYARSAAELDDLHQDALVNIWQGLPKFRGNSSLKTWVYRVTLNTCVSTFRSKSIKMEHIPISSIADTIDESAETQALLQNLHAGIGTLSPVDKAVIILWLEERSYDEIAELTGLSRSAVASRIHRAKDKLKKVL